MNKIFTYCFEKWLNPILFWGITLVLIIISEFVKQNIFDKISYILLSLSMFGLVVSAIYQLLKKRWIKGIITGLVFGGTIFAFLIYVVFSFFIDTVDGDKWADNLTIPKNIELNIPKGDGWQTRPDSILKIKRQKTDFELYNSFQPGLYEFDFWSSKIEKGVIYIKAFEVTQEYPLSTDRLPERSSVRVQNETDSIIRFSTKSHFTIYEGDWGKPYAARFEVWFKPDNGGKEKKLIEKTYKIEGWQR